LGLRRSDTNILPEGGDSKVPNLPEALCPTIHLYQLTHIPQVKDKDKSVPFDETFFEETEPIPNPTEGESVDTDVMTNAVGYVLPPGRYVVVPFLYDATKEDPEEEEESGEDSAEASVGEIDEDEEADKDSEDENDSADEDDAEEDGNNDEEDEDEIPITEGEFCLRILIQKPL